jgi:hypothetical protein
MMYQVSTEIGNFRDFPNIKSLALIHDRIAREIEELPQTRAGDERASLLNGRLWRLRGLIASTPPKTQADVQALIRICRAEAARDPDFECHVPGSAQDLTRALTEACWQGVGGKPCGLKAETRSIVVRIRVSEIGHDRIVVHPSDDTKQMMTIPVEDVLVFGGDNPKEESVA